MKRFISIITVCLLILLLPLEVSAGERHTLERLFPHTRYEGTLTESGERVRILEAEDGKHFDTGFT